MRKKFLKITITTILLICVCATIVNALSFTATMTPSSTTVAESTEFTVKIKVSNLDVGQGLSGLNGYFRYDTSVFEPITESSIEGLNGWNVTFNTENSKISLTKTTFVKSEEEVFQVILKTKSGVSGKTGDIKFTNILGTNSDIDITASDISTTITVGTINTNEANATNNTNSNGISITVTNRNNTANNTNTNTNKNTNNTPKNNTSYVNANSISNDNIPHTGVEDSMMYIIGALIIVSIVFYIKFEKVNKEMR